MNPLSQDSCVSSSEETRIKRESSIGLQDKVVGHSVDSNGVDSVCSPLKYDCLGTPTNEDSKIIKTFPWIIEFSKLCQSEIGLNKVHSLETLMLEYIRYVSVSALECHLKPNRSAKLKKAMNGTLLLFHLFYSEIKKPLEHSSYLDKMSDLMAIYIDMEITASSRSKESLYKIASKLTSSLFIFLDRSHDHILDSILKTKYMNKNYWELCNLIFSRVLRESPGRAICDMTYVRYVLAFKMWKRIVKGVDEKRNVMKLAAMRLHPPPHFKESVRAGIFSGILPIIPKSRNDITMFLMQAKFCIKEKSKAFLKQISTSEERGSFSSYMTSFYRTPFSNHIDNDCSKLSSEDDQEDNCGNSTALMNNIWTSMSGDSTVAHQIRVANIIKSKKQKSKCKKAKCKGIATPVFKMNAQTCDSLEKLKKKRRLQMSELAAIKPLSTTILPEKCSGPSNVTVVRPRMETEPTHQVQVSNVESCQSPVAASVVKKEPEITVDANVKINEQANQADTVCHSEKERAPLEITIAQSLIDETVEKIRETGRRYNKSQTKVQQSHVDPEQDLKPEPEVQKPIHDNKGTLHDLTLRRDYNIFTSQHAFRSNILNNSVSSEISVPSPYDNDGFDEASKRCSCVQCSANQTALITNFKILTQYLESKQGHCETSDTSTPDKSQDPEPSSCLPFKKRKTLPMEKDEEERDCKTSFGTRGEQVSYPNTPMISIAMLDHKAQTLCPESSKLYASAPCPETSALFPSVIDYSVSSGGSVVYETQPAHFAPTITEQVVVQPEAAPQQIVIEPTYPSRTYNTPENKPKFKTPAQLKESPVTKVPNNPQVAQNQLLNNSVSNNKRKSSNSNTSTVQKPKPKVKVDKNLRKRKY